MHACSVYCIIDNLKFSNVVQKKEVGNSGSYIMEFVFYACR